MAFSSRTDQLGPDRYLLTLTGELDLYTAAECREKLLELVDADAHEIVVDLSGATCIDPTTTGVFVITELALQRRGGQLVLVCDDSNSHERFDAAGLTRVFELRRAEPGKPSTRPQTGRPRGPDETETLPSDGPPARPTLIFFHSTVSGWAVRVDGFLANVLQRRRNHETFNLRRVSLERYPELAKRFGVGREPTLVVVEENVVVARLVDPRGSRDIEAFLAPWLRRGRERGAAPAAPAPVDAAAVALE